MARYHTPSGRCIQKPYTKGDKKAYEEDLLDRSKSGEYYCLDSISFSDSLRYTTLLHHRPIYGGGGVMPDIFVPVDTSEYSTYYRDMVAKGVVNQFAIDYVDKHRKDLKKEYPSLEDFDARFTVSDDMMKQFVAAGEKEKVKYDEEKYRTSERVFRTMIKALLARDVFADASAYTRIVNHRNRDLEAALKVLYDRELYDSLLQHGNPEYERLVKK